QWPEDAVAYFGDGDICHTAFHFPLMPRMYIALQMEDRFPVVDIMDQTPSIPEGCQWVIFLRNHDELTLEMVTDEERDYMYRAYARDSRARINVGIRRRLAPLLSNNRRTIELLNVLLMSLPGTPVIYYGDEIGMGDNYYLGDRNGVRTPMQWSPGKNAGFSDANPQKLYLPVIIDPEYHYETINVETQQANPASLLWWMKRIIATRKSLPAFGRGSLRFLYPENPRILAFLREHGEQTILVVVNLSQFSQAAELDLADFTGTVPVEIFSRNRFPRIRESTYPLTLGPYGYYWFLLERETEEAGAEEERPLPVVRSGEAWKSLGTGTKKSLERAVAQYLPRCRWFGEKSLTLRRVRIVESVPVQTTRGITHLLVIEVSYAERGPVRYLLPLSLASHEAGSMLYAAHPQSVVASGQLGQTEGMLFDALYDESFCEALLHLMARRRRHKGERGEVAGDRAAGFRRLLDERGMRLEPRVLRGEQSNTSILFDNVLILKVYRKLEEGINPDIEINRHLTEHAGFPHVPPYAGSAAYRTGGEEAPLCLLQGYVQNEGDAWSYTLNTLGQCFSRIAAEQPGDVASVHEHAPSFSIGFEDIPREHLDYLGGFFLEMMGLLGTRTARLHLALATRTEDPQFIPEPLSLLYLRSLYQSMRSQTRRTIGFLKKQLNRLPEETEILAERVAGMESEILDRQRRLTGGKMEGKKTRTHGDYHLGQVLFTGKDFAIIDFEGEPARPLSERRIKRSPLRDVAGMVRSFHYAVHTSYRQHLSTRPEDEEILEPWVSIWYHTVSGLFLGHYLDEALKGDMLPTDPEHRSVLLEAFLLEKALYEVAYELNNRPEWAAIPLLGLADLLGLEPEDDPGG
ncbi:MAG: putative maltokinase, partial [Spirochaetota bacterium]